MVQLVGGTELKSDTVSVEAGTAFPVLWTALQPDAVRAFLEEYRWLGGVKPLQHEIEFLSGQYGDPEIDDWLWFAPQLTKGRKWTALGNALISPYRSRTPTQRFGVYSDPRDVQV